MYKRVVIFLLDKVKFSIKSIRLDEEGYYIMVIIVIFIISLYVLYRMVVKYLK